MKSVNPNAVIDYVLESDRDLPVEEQTVWELGQLTAEEQQFLQDLQGATGTQIIMALHLGLRGAKHFFDPAGTPIVFRRDETKRVIVGKKRPWAEPTLTYITPQGRDELAAKITRGVGVEVPEAKNS